MILVTGANGWLGLNIIKAIVSGKTEKWGLPNGKITAFILNGTSKKQLNEISDDIQILEGDITNQEDLNRFFSKTDNSFLFHAAGVIHPKSVEQFFTINRDGTKKLLKTASKFSVKRAIIMSSNSPCGCNPSREYRFDELSPYNPYMNYGKSKMEMEIIAKKIYKEGLLDLSIIRSPWFYGPYQPSRQKLFFEMIRKGRVPIVGDGKNHRSMAYTENIVQGMVLASLKNIASGKTYWIADENSYSMNQIINTIEQLLEKNLGKRCNNGRIKLPNFIGQAAEFFDFYLQKLGFYHQKIHVLSEMNKNISCSINLAKKELGYHPEYSLENGMLKSLEEIYC